METQEHKRVSYQIYDFRKAANIKVSTKIGTESQIVYQYCNKQQNKNEKQCITYSNQQIQQIINFLVKKMRTRSGLPNRLAGKQSPNKSKYNNNQITKSEPDSTNQIKSKLQKNKEALKKRVAGMMLAQQAKVSNEVNNLSLNSQNGQYYENSQHQVQNQSEERLISKIDLNSIQSAKKIVSNVQILQGVIIPQHMTYNIKQILKQCLYQQVYWKQYTASLQKKIASQKEVIRRYQQLISNQKTQLSTHRKVIENYKIQISTLLKRHKIQISRISRSKILQQINENSKQLSKNSTFNIENWGQIDGDRPIKNGTKTIINSEVLGKSVSKALAVRAYVPTEDIKYLTQICTDSAYGTRCGVKNKNSTCQNFRSNKYFQRYNQTAKKQQHCSSNSNAGISRFKNNTNDDNASLFSNISNLNPGTSRNYTAGSLTRAKQHLKSSEQLKSIVQHKIIIESQHIDKEVSVKRSNTAVELHRKINLNNNKNILLREVDQLQKRKEAIIGQLAINSVKYEQCICDIDSLIENKKNKLLEIQKKRNSSAGSNSDSSSDLQKQMKDTIQDCEVLKISTKQNTNQKVKEGKFKKSKFSNQNKQNSQKL